MLVEKKSTRISKKFYFEQIKAYKKKKNAVILAHYYQDDSIQEIADFVGDSLFLAQKAKSTDADIIVFAGVYFMAETAKILNPDKKVIVLDREAGCSLVEGCPPDKFKAFIDKYPGHKVITYINSSIEVKAMSDVICTSSNALKIVRSFSDDTPLIFAPDYHLGRWVEKETGRKMVKWDGECVVHQAFAVDKLVRIMLDYPKAKLIAHPESHVDVLNMASFIGSTSALINHVKQSKDDIFIIGTEPGVLKEMRKLVPEKNLIPAPSVEDNSCSCSECAFMRLNTLEKLYLSLKQEKPEVTLNKEIREKALIPLERMLSYS